MEMTGIAPQPAQAQPAPQAPQQPGDQQLGDEEGQAPNVGPDEQAGYDDFVHAALALIYDGQKVREGIMNLLDNDPSDLKGILNSKELEQFSPIVAVAATTVVITLELVKMADATDKPSDDAIFHGASAIVSELIEIRMRRYKEDISEDDAHKALSMAADLYREAAADAGLVNLDELKQQFGELAQADKEGRLAEISPELAGINKAAEINMTQGDDPAAEGPPAMPQEQPQ